MKSEVVTLPFDVELLPVTQLKAGQLTCLYEHGNFRSIKLGNLEITRMLYAAVRDEHWNTAPYTIADETVQVNDDGFQISYTAFYKLNDIEYKGNITLTGAANKIEMHMHGEALTSFKRNRIGLCVLHPLNECAGETAVVERPDGTTYEAVFPKTISPHQPFLSIRKMQWKAAGQVSCILHFEGDVFETEDQRNWADGSYKTYSTPLTIPIPAPVQKGETIEQHIVLEVTPNEANIAAEKTTLGLIDEKQPSPTIGYARHTGRPQLSEKEIELLREIPFDHYRVEVRFNNDWKTELTNALAEAKGLHTKLEVVLFSDNSIESNLQAFCDFVRADASFIESVLPVSGHHKTTTAELLEVTYEILKKLKSDIKVGWGTDGFFAELNRNRPQNELYDFVSFSLNPQAHLSDTRTLIENLEAQADTVKTIKTFAPGKEIRISPITFKTRLPESNDERQRCGYDARQHTFFGAWWTLACLANLSEADALTFYYASGSCSILKKEMEQSTQEKNAYELSPLYETLARLKSFNAKWITKDSSNNIVFENAKGDKLVYNFSRSEC